MTTRSTDAVAIIEQKMTATANAVRYLHDMVQYWQRPAMRPSAYTRQMERVYRLARDAALAEGKALESALDAAKRKAERAASEPPPPRPARPRTNYWGLDDGERTPLD
jgi:hypothetical protein